MWFKTHHCYGNRTILFNSGCSQSMENESFDSFCVIRSNGIKRSTNGCYDTLHTLVLCEGIYFVDFEFRCDRLIDWIDSVRSFDVAQAVWKETQNKIRHRPKCFELSLSAEKQFQFLQIMSRLLKVIDLKPKTGRENPHIIWTGPDLRQTPSSPAYFTICRGTQNEMKSDTPSPWELSISSQIRNYFRPFDLNSE